MRTLVEGLREQLDGVYDDPHRAGQKLSPEDMTKLLDDAMENLYAARRGEEQITLDRATGVERPEVLSDGLKELGYKLRSKGEKLIPAHMQPLVKSTRKVLKSKLGRKIAGKLVSKETKIPEKWVNKAVDYAAKKDKAYSQWQKKQKKI